MSFGGGFGGFGQSKVATATKHACVRQGGFGSSNTPLSTGRSPHLLVRPFPLHMSRARRFFLGGELLESHGTSARILSLTRIFPRDRLWFHDHTPASGAPRIQRVAGFWAILLAASAAQEVLEVRRRCGGPFSHDR